MKVQRVTAIYTLYAICIDDTANVNTDDLKGFTRLCGGKTQPNSLLQHMLRFIGEEIPKFYGSFASDMIRKSIIEFACSCVVENEHHGKIMPSRTTPDFPYYFRHKTGLSEAYAFFFLLPETLFPEKTALAVYLPVISDIERYINLANDLLSFYKECVVGEEQFNYIYSHARSNEITLVESLRSTATGLTRCIHDIKVTLPAYPALNDSVTQVFHGYAVYHYSSSRHRLGELYLPNITADRVGNSVLLNVG